MSRLKASAVSKNWKDYLLEKSVTVEGNVHGNKMPIIIIASLCVHMSDACSNTHCRQVDAIGHKYKHYNTCVFKLCASCFVGEQSMWFLM